MADRRGRVMEKDGEAGERDKNTQCISMKMKKEQNTAKKNKELVVWS